MIIILKIQYNNGTRTEPTNQTKGMAMKDFLLSSMQHLIIRSSRYYTLDFVVAAIYCFTVVYSSIFLCIILMLTSATLEQSTYVRIVTQMSIGLQGNAINGVIG